MLNDGDRTTNFATAQEQTGWILYDLHTVCTFNRVDIYPASGQTVGFFFPKALSVRISEDGKEFKRSRRTPILMYTNVGSIRLDTAKARYIRIDIDDIEERLGQTIVEIGEIEVYLDNGKVPRWSFRRKKN